MVEPELLSRRVDPAHRGKRVDQVAAALFDDYSRGRLQVWIASGDLTLDGRTVPAKHRVTGGETLTLRVELEADETVAAQDIPINVVDQDDSLIVLDKPAGFVVHPAPGHRDGTLQNALLHFDPALAAIPRAGIVHRLDKDTTGIMVVARTLQAHQHLVEQLRRRSVRRVYEAIVWGQPPAEGVCTGAIGRHPRNRKKMAVTRSGKPAVSRFRCLERFGTGEGGCARLEVSLETGRTHQIRVHLSALGHPLVGDPLYGRRRPPQGEWPPEVAAALEAFPRQALHARDLALVHPLTGQEAAWSTRLPADMNGLLRSLREGD